MNQTLLMLRDAKSIAEWYITMFDPESSPVQWEKAERITQRLMHRNNLRMGRTICDINQMITDSGIVLSSPRMVDLIAARVYNLIRQSADLTDENNKLKEKSMEKQEEKQNESD